MWGATMVELATRRRPHEGCSEPEIAEGRLFERVGELRGCGNVGDALRELVGCCLRPRPEQRPSAEEVALRMQDCLAALGEFPVAQLPPQARLVAAAAAPANPYAASRNVARVRSREVEAAPREDALRRRVCRGEMRDEDPGGDA
jgi:hypothetical protein